MMIGASIGYEFFPYMLVRMSIWAFYIHITSSDQSENSCLPPPFRDKIWVEAPPLSACCSLYRHIGCRPGAGDLVWPKELYTINGKGVVGLIILRKIDDINFVGWQVSSTLGLWAVGYTLERLLFPWLNKNTTPKRHLFIQIILVNWSFQNTINGKKQI